MPESIGIEVVNKELPHFHSKFTSKYVFGRRGKTVISFPDFSLKVSVYDLKRVFCGKP